jgi:chemotaxis protein MotB
LGELEVVDMSAQNNRAPVIIKRKKVVQGGGHHGGAWKVAYADFVTAMMAFFMLMWLLNATTEQQRKGLADYFSPTIPIVRVSGGGNGAFAGESIFSEVIQPKSETGPTDGQHAPEDKPNGETGSDAPSAEETSAQDQLFESLEAMLQGRGGESLVMENALEHIITRITDEGLVIEVYSRNAFPIFEDDGAMPTPLLRDLALLISQMSKTVTNKIAIGGHVRAQPVVLKENSVWDLSQRRATQIRLLMEEYDVQAGRIQRVTGHADREPVVRNPMALRNDRIEIVLLRDIF